MLDCCRPAEEVKASGIVFQQMVCLARCNGADVRDVRADEGSEDQFRQDVIATCQDVCGLGKDCDSVMHWTDCFQRNSGRYSSRLRPDQVNAGH
jgi:glutathione gamma-glutamylcysteinyltransferase